MKTTIRLAFLALTTTLFAQNPLSKQSPSPETFHPATYVKSECITNAQRQQVREQLLINKQQILEDKPDAFRNGGGSPLFISPIKAKAGFDNPGFYIVNFQVDHDLAPNGNLTDYECNERTYDWATGNHEGTDYVIWPYPWKYMQEEVMEIVAAAPGIIIDKRDGNFDLNCDNSGNPNWNGIIIEHADGSQAWYWHFKDGAITTKAIGDTVAEGEYLGAAGSSGSSSIPHLHFEIYDASNNLIDPYEGTCNTLNSVSWWANQPDYYVPAINKISTHNSTNFDDTCGEVENTYEELNFLHGEDIVLRIFFRDIQTNSDTHIVITDPNGTTLYDYIFTSPWPNYEAAYAEWIFPTDSSWADGVYEVTATFGGTAYETIFGINTTLGVEDVATNSITMYPNPVHEKLIVESTATIEMITIVDLAGRKVLEIAPKNSLAELNLSTMSSGVYLAIITSEGKKAVKKLVKQ